MSDGMLLQPGWREAWHSVNGVTLHTVEAGEPGSPLVLLLHGFPEFWWAWRRQITPLAEAGYHVVAPDLRGYNSSDVPHGLRAYHLDVLAGDVAALADAHGADRFHVVGHDWGAVISWWVAARHPRRVQRLVVMDGPHPDTVLRQVITHPTQAVRSSYAAFFQLPRGPEAVLGTARFAGLRTALRTTSRRGAFPPADLAHYVRAWSHPGSLTGMLNYYRALRLRKPGTASRITSPTLVLWGENDQFLGLHLARRGLALCDQGRLVVLGGATHWLHHEQPDRVTAEILGFLDEDGG
jgi:epoxide hydrolase 4